MARWDAVLGTAADVSAAVQPAAASARTVRRWQRNRAAAPPLTNDSIGDAGDEPGSQPETGALEQIGVQAAKSIPAGNAEDEDGAGAGGQTDDHLKGRRQSARTADGHQHHLPDRKSAWELACLVPISDRSRGQSFQLS